MHLNLFTFGYDELCTGSCFGSVRNVQKSVPAVYIYKYTATPFLGLSAARWWLWWVR